MTRELRDRAKRQFDRLMEQKQPARIIHRAVMGDGSGNIRVASRPDLVYVRLKAKGDALWKVFNDKVTDVENLPVLIEKRPVGDIWEVIDVDKTSLMYTGDGWENVNYGGNHASMHEWPDYAPGADPVNVYPRAVVPLRSYATYQDGLLVTVAPLRYTYAGELKKFDGTTMDLSAHQPAAGKARNVLTYLDPTDNTMKVTLGAVTTYSAVVTPPLPLIPEYAIPSALIKLWERNYVTEQDVTDYRLLLDKIQPDDASTLTDFNITDPEEYQVLTYLGDEWVNKSPYDAHIATYTPEYIVVSYTGDLPSERLLKAAPGEGLKATDAGANAEFELGLDFPSLPSTATYADADELAIVQGGVHKRIATSDIIPPPGSGGGGAPTDAEYLVLTYDGDLSDERLFKAAPGEGIKGTDAGANAEYEIGLDFPNLPAATTYEDADEIAIVQSGVHKRIPTSEIIPPPGAGAAPIDAEYLVLTYDGTLLNERLFKAAPGEGLKGIDAGANAEYEVALDFPNLPLVSTYAAADEIAIVQGGTHRRIATSDIIPPTESGFPFELVTVDLTNIFADYNSLETAFANEGESKVYELGPGTHTLTSTPMPANSRLVSDVGSGLIKYAGVTGYTALGISYGLPTDGTVDVDRVRANATSNGTDDAIGFDHQGGRLLHCMGIATANGSGDAFAVDVDGGVTAYIYGGEFGSTSGSGEAYAIRVGSGASLYLYNLPALWGTDGAIKNDGGTVYGWYYDVLTGELVNANDGIITIDESASDPATPATGSWSLYAKSGGLYIKDDAAAVVGPLAAGGATTQQMSHVLAYRSSALTLTNGSFTTIIGNTETYDVLGEHDTSNGRFTATYDGYYSVSAMILIAQTATLSGTETAVLGIYINGSLSRILDRLTDLSGASVYPWLQGTGTFYLTADQYLEVRVNQSSGGNLGLYTGAGTHYNWYTIDRLPDYAATS